jgi:hypothetical protein
MRQWGRACYPARACRFAASLDAMPGRPLGSGKTRALRRHEPWRDSGQALAELPAAGLGRLVVAPTLEQERAPMAVVSPGTPESGPVASDRHPPPRPGAPGRQSPGLMIAAGNRWVVSRSVGAGGFMRRVCHTIGAPTS